MFLLARKIYLYIVLYYAAEWQIATNDVKLIHHYGTSGKIYVHKLEVVFIWISMHVEQMKRSG